MAAKKTKKAKQPTLKFDYGIASVKELGVELALDQKGKSTVTRVKLKDRSLRPTKRFWNSLHLRFGFTDNIFRYFSHQEVFQRIAERAPNDELRYCIEDDGNGDAKLLGVTSPTAPVIRHEELADLLKKHGSSETRYHEGMVTSRHDPRNAGGPFQINGDGFEQKFVIDTPIDGFGRPAVYLSMLRLICSNGMIGYSPTFRSELSVGKSEQGVTFALLRVLEGFNNEEGFAAMRQRFESAANSWASVAEVNKLYKVLTRLHSQQGIRTQAPIGAKGGDGAELMDRSSPLFSSFHKMTGDLSQIYGLANLNSLSIKRQRTLPTACRTYDLINFATEVATHHATESGNRSLQAYVGDLISHEYDLEGTAEQFADWRDFFIGSSATTETLVEMN